MQSCLSSLWIKSLRKFEAWPFWNFTTVFLYYPHVPHIVISIATSIIRQRAVPVPKFTSSTAPQVVGIYCHLMLNLNRPKLEWPQTKSICFLVAVQVFHLIQQQRTEAQCQHFLSNIITWGRWEIKAVFTTICCVLQGGMEGSV